MKTVSMYFLMIMIGFLLAETSWTFSDWQPWVVCVLSGMFISFLEGKDNAYR